MKKKLFVMAVLLGALLLCCASASAREVTNEFFYNEMTPEDQAQYAAQNSVKCAACGKWFINQTEFEKHICSGDQSDRHFCTICQKWYNSGYDYMNHVCSAPESDSHFCTICQKWYYSGYDYMNHVCVAPTTEYIQCSVCGGWYEAGNIYRNHVCVPKNQSSSNTNKNLTAIGTLYVNTANGKSLNMRKSATTGSDVVTSIPNGAAVTLYQYANSSWAYVSYRNTYGYCMTRHLSETKPTSTGSSSSSTASSTTTTTVNTNTTDLNVMFKNMTPAFYEATVTPSNPSGFVNMRWAPTKASPVVSIYYSGETLRVLSTDGTWSQVYDDAEGVCGFIMNAYLKRIVE